MPSIIEARLMPKTVNQFQEHSRLFTVLQEPDKPILGAQDSNILATNISAFLSDPSTTVVELRHTSQLIGFSVALPLEKFEPEKKNEEHTAYLYATVLDLQHRHRGHVGKLTDLLFKELFSKGFEYIERDCLIKDGYADTVERHYSKSGSIVELRDEVRWKEIGPERHFRINIRTYLEWLDQQHQ